MTPLRIWKRFALAGVGIGVGLIALELLLRVANPFCQRLRSDRIVLPVNHRYVVRNTAIPGLAPEIVRTVNALGFRGPNPPDDINRYLSIITVGGSTTECAYVNDQRTWPDQMGARLAGTFERVWVNNAGLDGHSTFGHAVLLRDYLTGLRPKVIVFLVGANDVERGDLVPFEQSHIRGSLKQDSLPHLLKALSAYSELASTALNLYRVVRARRAGLAHLAMDLRELGSKQTSAEQRAAVLAMHQQRFLDPYAHRLRRLAALSRHAGSLPVFITQPALYGGGSDDVTGVDLGRVRVGDVDGETQWEILELYNETTRRIGRELGIPVIDLARELPKSSRYFYDLLHLTETGCAKVGEIVSAQLADHLASAFPAFVRSEQRTTMAQLAPRGATH